MRIAAVLLGALVTAAVATTPVAARQDPTPAPPGAPAVEVIRETELDRQTKALASQLRCVVCQGLSIQDSPSGLAQEMRAVVREQLEAGKSADEVKAWFVDKYGEWVLMKPKAQGFNLLVYLLPVGMIVAGAGFVYMKARHWTRGAAA